jgi:hypothetical protein
MADARGKAGKLREAIPGRLATQGRSDPQVKAGQLL